MVVTNDKTCITRWASHSKFKDPHIKSIQHHLEIRFPYHRLVGFSFVTLILSSGTYIISHYFKI